MRTKEDIDAWLGVDGEEAAADAAVSHRRCPYVGTLEDQASIMAYASRANRCFRHGAPRHVSLLRQDQHCLQSNYSTCHIFRQPADRRLAPSPLSQPSSPARYYETPPQTIGLTSWLLAAVALLAVSAGLILLWLGSTF